MAEEIANYNIPDGSRKINGKYIQSHLLSRLQGMTWKYVRFDIFISSHSNDALLLPYGRSEVNILSAGIKK